MTKETAKNVRLRCPDDKMRWDIFVDDLFEELDNETCENCFYGEVPKDSRYRECNYWQHIRIKTHGCNRFEKA